GGRLRLARTTRLATGRRVAQAEERGATRQAAAIGVHKRALLADHPADGGARPAGVLRADAGALPAASRSADVRHRLPALGLRRTGQRAAPGPPATGYASKDHGRERARALPTLKRFLVFLRECHPELAKDPRLRR